MVSSDFINEAGIRDQYDLFQLTPGINYGEARDRNGFDGYALRVGDVGENRLGAARARFRRVRAAALVHGSDGLHAFDPDSEVGDSRWKKFVRGIEFEKRVVADLQVQESRLAFGVLQAERSLKPIVSA